MALYSIHNKHWWNASEIGAKLARQDNIWKGGKRRCKYQHWSLINASKVMIWMLVKVNIPPPSRFLVIKLFFCSAPRGLNQFPKFPLVFIKWSVQAYEMKTITCAGNLQPTSWDKASHRANFSTLLSWPTALALEIQQTPLWQVGWPFPNSQKGRHDWL